MSDEARAWRTRCIIQSALLVVAGVALAWQAWYNTPEPAEPTASEVRVLIEWPWLEDQIDAQDEEQVPPRYVPRRPGPYLDG